MPLSLEYIAGFFDGEGNLHVSRRVRATTDDSIQFSYALDISISNTYAPVIGMLLEQFPFGGYTMQPNQYREDRYKSGHVFRASGSNALEFLRKIHPHLVVKSVAASLTITLFDSIQTYNRSIPYVPVGGTPYRGKVRRLARGTILPQEEEDRRSNLYERIRALTKRGA